MSIRTMNETKLNTNRYKVKMTSRQFDKFLDKVLFNGDMDKRVNEGVSNKEELIEFLDALELFNNKKKVNCLKCALGELNDDEVFAFIDVKQFINSIGSIDEVEAFARYNKKYVCKDVWFSIHCNIDNEDEDKDSTGQIYFFILKCVDWIKLCRDMDREERLMRSKIYYFFYRLKENFRENKIFLKTY